jgi:hypothetical protein
MDNTKKLSEPFDPTQPIESFFRTIQNTVDYAYAGHAPFGVDQIIEQPYTHLFNSGILLYACEKWNGRPLADKKWNNLELHFTRAHKTYCLTRNTAIGAGYNMANAATTEFQQDTVEAIANLVNAAATDKGMIDTIKNTNTTLTTHLSEVCFGSSRATVNHSRLRQICIRDLTNIQYLIPAGIINKISNRGYGCAGEAGEAGEPGAEEERPDEQYENRNRN